MRHHVILKLWRRLPRDLAIPYWPDYITDKSATTGSVEPDVDAVLADAGAEVWVTREYAPARPGWDDAEVQAGLDRTYRLILVHPEVLDARTIARLGALPGVESARLLEVGAGTLPNPELATEATRHSRAADLIHLAYAKALTRGNPDVVVAVLDTGADVDHVELRGRFAGQADFVDLHGLDTTNFIGDIVDPDAVAEDEVGHGTHVSGILAARGVAMAEGVAPGCRLLAVRVLATLREGTHVTGAGVVDNINTGIKYAVDHGADVVNMSLGIRHSAGGLPHEDVIRYAQSRDVTVVAASGNDGTDEKYYPGALPGVLAVGAADDDGAVTPFTSFGAPISVLAPGVAIESCFAHHTYATASGTSQASPFVAGTAALMKSYARDLGRRLATSDIAGILRETSDKPGTRMYERRSGFGLINLADAFKLLAHSLS